LGDISCQRKGFESGIYKALETHQSFVTQIGRLHGDEKNASTNGFIEYKSPIIYNTTHTPKDELSAPFFKTERRRMESILPSKSLRVKLHLEKGT
jgi:hypothetical protein